MKHILILLMLLLAAPVFAVEEVKTAVGVADSSIKTVVGVATASAKSMCGVDYNDSDVVLSCSGTTNQADSLAVDNHGYSDIAKVSAFVWNAIRVQYKGTNGAELCRIDLILKKTCGTSCTGNLDVDLYSDDGGGTPHPSSSLSSCDAKAIDSLQTTAQWESFANCSNSVSLTTDTYYWIVIRKDAAADATNYASIAYDNTCTLERVDYDDDGSGWSTYNTTLCFAHKYYGLE